jgi:hypothetical protein
LEYQNPVDLIDVDLLLNVEYETRESEPNYIIGRRLENAVRLALRYLDIPFGDMTKRTQEGGTPDFVTSKCVIEVKNIIGSVAGRYRIDHDKYYNSIIPRYTHYQNLRKILIISKGANWVPYVRRQALRDGVKIIEVPAIFTDEEIIPVSKIIAKEIHPYVV